jgi:hypothetical protein
VSANKKHGATAVLSVEAPPSESGGWLRVDTSRLHSVQPHGGAAHIDADPVVTDDGDYLAIDYIAGQMDATTYQHMYNGVYWAVNHPLPGVVNIVSARLETDFSEMAAHPTACDMVGVAPGGARMNWDDGTSYRSVRGGAYHYLKDGVPEAIATIDTTTSDTYYQRVGAPQYSYVSWFSVNSLLESTNSGSDTPNSHFPVGYSVTESDVIPLPTTNLNSYADHGMPRTFLSMREGDYTIDPGTIGQRVTAKVKLHVAAVDVTEAFLPERGAWVTVTPEMVGAPIYIPAGTTLIGDGTPTDEGDGYLRFYGSHGNSPGNNSTRVVWDVDISSVGMVWDGCHALVIEATPMTDRSDPSVNNWHYVDNASTLASSLTFSLRDPGWGADPNEMRFSAGIMFSGGNGGAVYAAPMMHRWNTYTQTYSQKTKIFQDTQPVLPTVVTLLVAAPAPGPPFGGWAALVQDQTYRTVAFRRIFSSEHTGCTANLTYPQQDITAAGGRLSVLLGRTAVSDNAGGVYVRLRLKVIRFRPDLLE